MLDRIISKNCFQEYVAIAEKVGCKFSISLNHGLMTNASLVSLPRKSRMNLKKGAWQLEIACGRLRKMLG